MTLFFSKTAPNRSDWLRVDWAIGGSGEAGGGVGEFVILTTANGSSFGLCA